MRSTRLLLPEERGFMDVEGLKADLARKADPAMKAWVRDHLGMNVDHYLGCRMPVVR